MSLEESSLPFYKAWVHHYTFSCSHFNVDEDWFMYCMGQEL